MGFARIPAMELEKENVLKDTIRACISIISRGESV